MFIFKQFDSLIVEQLEMDVYDYTRHSHNYYEIIYIHKGSGLHNLNNLVIPYTSGDLFLMSPGDYHTFDIEVQTVLTFIRFTDDYFSNNQNVVPESFRTFSPSSIMQSTLFKENKIELSEISKQMLEAVVDSIVAYSQTSQSKSFSPSVFYLILTIMGIVWETARDLQGSIQPGPIKEQLVNYIHQHIYDRSRLSISNISSLFGISDNYFSSYFKRKFGMNYNAYLAAYRNKMIEQRLITGNMTLSEIAQEFGFFDESHFTKYCKKQFGINPKQIGRG